MYLIHQQMGSIWNANGIPIDLTDPHCNQTKWLPPTLQTLNRIQWEIPKAGYQIKV